MSLQSKASYAAPYLGGASLSLSVRPQEPVAGGGSLLDFWNILTQRVLILTPDLPFCFRPFYPWSWVSYFPTQCAPSPNMHQPAPKKEFSAVSLWKRALEILLPGHVSPESLCLRA